LSNYSFKYRILNKLEQWGVLKFLNLKIKTKVNQRSFYIPIIGGLGLGNLVKEEPWMDYLLNNISSTYQNLVFIDVGVNIGQTLLKVKSVFPKIEYVGFEPNPYCVSYLHQLIASNQIINTTILPIAIANETNVFPLLFDNESLSDSSAGIIKTYRKGKFRKIDILAFQLKHFSYLNEKKIGIVKIDVEGAELEVLSQLVEIIKSNKPIIILEILPVYSIKNEDRYERQIKIQEFINLIEYEIFRIDMSSSLYTNIKELEIHSDLSLCNYLLTPYK
jgi:FkbM family methyltransferase